MANEEDGHRQASAARWTGILRFFFAAAFLVVAIIDVSAESASTIFLLPILLAMVCAKWLRSARRQNRRGTALHRQRMEAAFSRDAVRNVAALVREDYGDPSAKDPESGVYQVDFRETTILDSKTSNVLYGGFPNRSVLTIQLTRDIESNGWSIQGSRKGAEKDFYVISEGFVAPSGKTYWVETNDHQSILVFGVFQGDAFTNGEWLSSNGDRGRYTEFRRLEVIQADTAIMLGNEEHVLKDTDKLEDPLLVC
jgi:hypothetical protein